MAGEESAEIAVSTVAGTGTVPRNGTAANSQLVFFGFYKIPAWNASSLPHEHGCLQAKLLFTSFRFKMLVNFTWLETREEGGSAYIPRHFLFAYARRG